MWTNSVGLALSLSAIWLLRTYGQDWPVRTVGVVVVCAALAVPIIVLEWLARSRRQLPVTKPRGSALKLFGGGDLKRLLTKLLGFYACVGLIAAVYAIFPEYEKGMYRAWFDCVTALLPWLLLAAVPYFYFVDRKMPDPADGYWHFGRLLLGRTANLDRNRIWQLHLGWIVKLFFLPLMFGYAGDNLTKIVHFDFSRLFRDFRTFFDFSYNFVFYIDLLFVTAGYACTLRLCDSHIRSTEPTCLGWVAALICYQPFWGLIYLQYLWYDSSPSWAAWLWNYPALTALWGSGILLLLGVYAWASMAFGVRFSNLTHRGILTNGPYRFSRHPAYIAKNLSWWMIAMPFMIDTGLGETLRHMVLLLFVNFVYFVRARTEERHLAADPDYVAYAEYIDRHGMFAWLGKLLPILRFKGGGLWVYQPPPRRHYD